MERKIYEIVEMKNGLKMMAVLPINETGIAEAYCTIRDNPIGNSKGPCGPFSCNIYKKYGLDDGIADFKLCCEALGISPSQVITNRLTHFTNIVRDVNVESLEDYNIYNEEAAPHADGLITDSVDVTLMNYAADCSIIMFVDPEYRLVGSLHAAWKGSLLGIIENEVEAFKNKTNADISNLIAVIMPSISQEKFEVGTEVAQKFISAGFSEHVDLTSYDKPHINLSGVNRSILLKCGLNRQNVYVIDGLCTVKNEELFHSFRRGPIDEEGRHLNGMNGYFIKLK